LCNGGWSTTTQEIALDVVDAALFDFAFMFGGARPTGCEQKAVVLGTLAVGLLHLRVVPAGFGDGGLEVVEHDALRHTAEEIEGVPVQKQPGRDTLVPHKFDVLVAAEAEHHHESPGFA